jgi:predicted glycoside hydrolase/deacetylase ChbG (UPF0249 family)
MLELAQEYGAAIRRVMAGTQTPIEEYAPRLMKEFKPRTPDFFCASFYDEDATKAELLRLIESLKPGTTEIMCHPGYADTVLLAGSVYARQRERELAILTDPEVRAAIQSRGIVLISFAEL